jgi:predicted pyridoxine 5'-phosphate oxidase superfamily flavin-nucleotide-binding protein
VTSSSTPQQAQSTDLRQLAFGLLEQVWLAQQAQLAQQVHLAQLEQHCAAVLVRLQLALAATVTSTSTPQLQRSTDLRQLAYGLQV